MNTTLLNAICLSLGRPVNGWVTADTDENLKDLWLELKPAIDLYSDYVWTPEKVYRKGYEYTWSIHAIPWQKNATRSEVFAGLIAENVFVGIHGTVPRVIREIAKGTLVAAHSVSVGVY